MQTILQHLLPHKLICGFAGLCANCNIIWIKNFLIRYFINRYAVKMQEAVEPDPFAYPTYNAFFTRALKPECRPIDQKINSIVSAADGAIAQIGYISQQKIVQAKKHNYDLAALLGGDKALTTTFAEGSFATIYLAPKDYHRIHMPIDGTLSKMIYVPGKLFSVNEHAANNIPNLFARNERVITVFNSPQGPFAVILVGAMIVGSIETVWHGQVTPPHSPKMHIWNYDGKTFLAKGAELGRFNLGSTVILLFTKDRCTWLRSMQPGASVNMGQGIGEIG